jgi:hypothetical protein
MSGDEKSLDVDELIERLVGLEFPFGDDQPSGFERMTEDRFNALGLWGLPQGFRDEFLFASFWSADQERLPWPRLPRSGIPQSGAPRSRP